MPKQRSGHVALVCDLNALTREQRQRYQTVVTLLRASVEEVREIEAGYALRHPAEEPVLLQLAEFVGLERRCCPFLGFTVEVESEVGPVWLSITGDGRREAISPRRARSGWGSAVKAVVGAVDRGLLTRAAPRTAQRD